MKLKSFFPFVLCLSFFISCQVDETVNDQQNEDTTELSFSVIAQTYNYCSLEWLNTHASLSFISKDEVLFETDLFSTENVIQVPEGIDEFRMVVSKLGCLDETVDVSVADLNNIDNESFVFQLEPKTFEGNVRIESIEDYNIFIANEYGKVNGDVILAQTNDISDFEGLQSLTSIEGGLRVVKMGNLESLAGLENLKYIGGDLLVFDNLILQNIRALQSVTCLGDYLWVQDNPELVNLEGLDGLTSLPNDFEIINNEKLSSIQGVQNLKHVEGNILIQGNYALTNINELSGLTTISKDFELGGNGISSLKGLENVTSIGGSLSLLELPIVSLDGLESIVSIDGNLDVYNNSNLYDWCALQTLFNNDGLGGGHLFGNCSFNPTIQEIKSGNCSG